MNIIENILNNEIIIKNLTDIFSAFALAFLSVFLLTPWIGRLALKVGGVDLPVSKLTGREGNFKSRMNEGLKPRMGGFAQALGILIAASFFSTQIDIPTGIWYGFFILLIVGVLDDIYCLSGKVQLLAQILAAVIVVFSGVSIPEEINLLNFSLDLNFFEIAIRLGGFAFDFIFPGHLITILWIVGIVNVINWVGGVDGLNISVSSIIGATFFLIAMSQGSIPLVILISVFLGSNLGLLPYNYNPSKIIPGSSSEYINGYFLAVFALMGPTGWTATLIIFALPIIDAAIVIFLRTKSNPEVLSNPLKILSINDRNHLHHRLLDAGYTRKGVLFIEICIVTLVCSIALFFGIDTTEDLSNKVVVAFAVATGVLVAFFTGVYILMKKAQLREERRKAIENQKKAIVKVIVDQKKKEEEEYERFYY